MAELCQNPVYPVDPVKKQAVAQHALWPQRLCVEKSTVGAICGLKHMSIFIRRFTQMIADHHQPDLRYSACICG
jgi:hypothetical protein